MSADGDHPLMIGLICFLVIKHGVIDVLAADVEARRRHIDDSRVVIDTQLFDKCGWHFDPKFRPWVDNKCCWSICGKNWMCCINPANILKHYHKFRIVGRTCGFLGVLSFGSTSHGCLSTVTMIELKHQWNAGNFSKRKSFASCSLLRAERF